MSGLNIYTSNRIETLVGHLAGVVAEPLSSPFVSEVIVVQSKGMERWLSMELARELGVWSNCRFPFPNRFMLEIFKAVSDDVLDPDLLNPQVNAWRIAKVLPDCLQREGFESLRRYLSDTQLNLKKLQLAERIADAFDTYAVFRPEQVLGWDRGIEHHWQAQLWRLLFRDETSAHRARIWRNALKRLSDQERVHGFDGLDDSIRKRVLPERVSVFGIPALPRYHLEVLKALAARIPVHLFLFNPSKEYWADIVPERRIVSIERSEGSKSHSPLDMHFEVGNPLLASLGTLGRDFFRAIVDLQSEPLSDFVDPGENSLLFAIQSDILALRNRGADSIKTEVHSHDTSLQIHSCHGPWREIEVLYDRLLHLFETDRNLTPKDILVMTPDIETYAPYITAVFDACQDEKKRIPYSIADRRAPSQSIVIDLFLKIIGLSRGRLRAPEIIDILGCAAVRTRLGLSAEEMDRIHHWIFETGVRWGIDGEQRASFGLPPFEENSWKAGIERLILGYSMMGGEEELFAGKLPYAVLGDEADTLGPFLIFLEQLFDMVRTLDEPRTLAEWSDTLVSLRSTFIMEDEETVSDVQLLDDELKGLKRLQQMSGFDEPVEIEVVRYFLSTQLGQVQLSRGFLAGGVTFCEMLPMRSIPHPVIALIGMNSDAYPREERAVAFDLIAQDPHPGDRSLRDEDRYLFLEALLSARDYLYVSYVGQSVRDNSVIPPSVLVSELLDYCEQGFSVAGSSVSQFLLTNHRLQPFSASYFTREGRFFSYSQEDFDTAIARSKPHQQPVHFISKPLDEPPAEWKHVSITNLKRFYQNPARYLLKYRLGINLEEPDHILPGEEPFSLDGLDAYLLGDLLVRKNLEGKELTQYIGLARARGILPPGIPGELAYSSLKARAEAFSELVRSHAALPMLAPIEVDFDLAGFRISGRLGAHSSGMVLFHFAKDKGRYQIAAWIDHLILNLVSEPEYPRETHLITTDKSWLFGRVEEAAPLIETLLRLYWQGISEPLRFFPESSMLYAERLKKGERISDALTSAQSVWQGSDFVPGTTGEGNDPYLNLCFSDTSPFSDPFAEITLTVLEPLLEHRERVR